MAKTVKDITSFEGGMVNAIEPSDSGEDATGSYESINTDGIQKKGVLRPSGSFKAFSPTINLIHNTTSTTGTGFYIWQQAFNFDTANFVASCTFNATSSSDYTISGGSGTLTDEGSYLLWKGINKQYGYFVLKSGAFESGFSAPWEDGALYKYMLNSDPDRGTVNTLAANWIALDKECYDEAWGVDTVPSDYQYEQRVGYFISNGTYPKFSMISNENDTLSSGVKLYSLKIYKEIISGSHEYQFINRKSGGLNRVDVYMDGGDEAGLIGDTVTEIIMGASNGIPSVDYLNANNALRLYDSDFDNTNTPNRFFGVHNAIFFEGLESKPDPGETAAGIIPSGQTGVSLSVKRRLWLDEEAALQAPEADSCAVLANGDMRNAWASGADTVISNHYLHRFTAADDMDLSSLDYWIGLEYEVVKSGHTTESLTGTWNVAVDNEAPTVLETGILYRFYVTFSYDQGAQESEMVQIMNVQEQGRHWQGVASGSVSESWGFSNYNNFIHDYPSNTNDLGDIRLLFHDADTGDSGVIDYFLSDTPAGYCWCYAPNHNLVKGQTVTITSSSGLFDMTIIVSDVKAERFQINTAAGSGVNPGEDGTFTWDGKYVAREAFDCAVNFKPFFLTSVKGPGGWGMPERATGLNYLKMDMQSHFRAAGMAELVANYCANCTVVYSVIGF